MKTLLPLCLGTALLLAASPLPLPAADASKAAPAVPAKDGEGKPKETDEQKVVRHDRETKEAEVKINALAKELPLLNGPGWEANYGKFRAQLAKVQADPELKRNFSPVHKPALGRPFAPLTLAQFQEERRAAMLATMRQQSDKVLETHPELRAYVDQQFQWHRRLFELQDQCPDNPQVRQLVRNRLEVVVVPTTNKRTPAK